MKDWKELTDFELDALTDDEIEHIEDVLCAEAGIPLEEKPEKVSIELPKKDVTVFQIRGIGMSNILLTSLDEANQLVSLLKTFKSIGTSTYGEGVEYYTKGTQRDYNNKPLDITLGSEEMVSAESIDEYRKAKVLLEEYNKRVKRYNRVLDMREEKTKNFHEALSTARETMYRRRNYANIFYRKYLPTAEGNTEVAMKFLKQAYDVSKEDEQYILNNPIKTE